MPAWGCTAYKIQSLSLEKIVVSFQLLKQRNFNYGQIYESEKKFWKWTSSAE